MHSTLRDVSQDQATIKGIPQDQETLKGTPHDQAALKDISKDQATKEGWLPARPPLTPIFVCAVFMWGFCALAFTLLRTAKTYTAAFLFFGTLSIIIVVLIKRQSFKAIIFGALAGILAGSLCASAEALYLHSVNERIAKDLSGEAFIATATLVEDAKKSSYGTEAFARLVMPDNFSVLTSIKLPPDTEPLYQGDVITTTARLTSAPFDRSDFWWKKGVAVQAEAQKIKRTANAGFAQPFLDVRRNALTAFKALEGDEAMLLEALICGSRERIQSSALYADFKKCGIAHLVAVSGAHLVVVAGITLAVMKALRMPRILVILITLVHVGAFLILAGMPISALRAALMMVVGMSSYFARRRPFGLSSIGLCMIVLLVLNPTTAVSVSFALSVLSTAGIVLFARLIAGWLTIRSLRTLDIIIDSVALTLSANMLSLPLCLALFSQVSLIAVLANVVTAPLFPFVCGFGLIAAVAAPNSIVFSALVTIARGIASVFCTVVHTMAAIPYASIPASLDFSLAVFLTVGSAAALWALWPHMRSKKALIFVSGLLVVPWLCAALISFPDVDKIVMIDVGQGDAILLQSDGVNVLVDTGNRDSALLEGLARQKVCNLDAVIITHSDDDHCGSLDALEGALDVEYILLAQGMLSSEETSCQALRTQAERTAKTVLPLAVGDVIQVGVFSARVVWPIQFSDGGGNKDSIVLDLEADLDSDGLAEAHALLTGDADKEILDQIRKNYDIGSLDILKVCHHGSKTGLDEELAEYLNPRVALIGVGAYNRYGHPAPEIINVLEAQDAVIARTDRDGDISCIITKDGIKITTQR